MQDASFNRNGFYVSMRCPTQERNFTYQNRIMYSSVFCYPFNVTSASEGYLVIWSFVGYLMHTQGFLLPFYADMETRGLSPPPPPPRAHCFLLQLFPDTLSSIITNPHIIWEIYPMLAQCWASVADVGPELTQLWVYVLFAHLMVA